jgi:ribosomal protein S18 acetylase RimI-like enzyme
MIVLEPIAAHNAMILKEVRLRALKDSPKAFGSTYVREAQLSDEEWIERSVRWGSGRSAAFLAMENGAACGIAASLLDEKDTTKAQLLSMWTAPGHRQRGIGQMLVKEIMAWANQRGVRTLQLMVVSSNETAIAFYERLGFTRTGRTETYPNDPALLEYEMSRPLP